MPDALGDRMKRYELPYKYVLPRRMPVIIRVDGKAFHAATKELDVPFDYGFMGLMDQVAVSLCEAVQGAVLGFVQSDEISILLHNYRTLNTEPWFDNELQKMVSVAAACASSTLTELWKPVQFDARAFVLPEAEVCNYFIWRQQDATRNSIQMATRAVYSHKEVYGKNTSDMHEMLHAKNINWNDYPVGAKRGRAIVREEFQVKEHNGENLVTRHRWVSQEPPIFTTDRDYIDKRLELDEA